MRDEGLLKGNDSLRPSAVPRLAQRGSTAESKEKRRIVRAAIGVASCVFLASFATAAEAVPTESELIVDVDCRVETGRVGLATRCDAKSRQGCAMLVDPIRKELQFAELAPMYAKGMILKVLERHRIRSRIGSAFRMSVISSRDYQLVFVDDVFAGAYSFMRRDPGAVSIVMENATGQCVVSGIRARTVKAAPEI